LAWRGNPYKVEDLPSPLQFLVHFILSALIEEFGFYYSHRLAHHPSIYKYIHKKHHEFTAPIAITAVYAHWLEHIVSNMSPILLGPLILGSHTIFIWFWISLAIISTLNAHSGYHLPFYLSSEQHDYHHSKGFTQNFGTLGILDWFHGTDGQFRKSKNFKRHIVLWGLTPAKQLIPDDEDTQDTDNKLSNGQSNHSKSNGTSH